MIYKYQSISNLTKLKNKNFQVGIIERKPPSNSDVFFRKLYKHSFALFGSVSKINAKKDIKKVLENQIPLDIQSDTFYEDWIEDMSNVCKIFCSFKNADIISFWLGSKRGCKRYHVDMVPIRLLVTYAGQGTELLPDKFADRDAFFNGKSNEEILKDKSAIKFLNEWDIALFRGGEKGILHRTPDSALKRRSSILMRLDDKSFLQNFQLTE